MQTGLPSLFIRRKNGNGFGNLINILKLCFFLRYYNFVVFIQTAQEEEEKLLFCSRLINKQDLKEYIVKSKNNFEEQKKSSFEFLPQLFSFLEAGVSRRRNGVIGFNSCSK